MKDKLKTGFEDRIAAAAEAKKALVAKLKPKPAVAATEFVDRATRKAAELQAVRDARAAAKLAATEAKAATEAETEAARLAAEQAELDAKRSQRKERKALTTAEAKAKRDAKYAARQARRH